MKYTTAVVTTIFCFAQFSTALPVGKRQVSGEPGIYGPKWGQDSSYSPKDQLLVRSVKQVGQDLISASAASLASNPSTLPYVESGSDTKNPKVIVNTPKITTQNKKLDKGSQKVAGSMPVVKGTSNSTLDVAKFRNTTDSAVSDSSGSASQDESVEEENWDTEADQSDSIEPENEEWSEETYQEEQPLTEETPSPKADVEELTPGPNALEAPTAVSDEGASVPQDQADLQTPEAGSDGASTNVALDAKSTDGSESSSTDITDSESLLGEAVPEVNVNEASLEATASNQSDSSYTELPENVPENVPSGTAESNDLPQSNTEAYIDPTSVNRVYADMYN